MNKTTLCIALMLLIYALSFSYANTTYINSLPYVINNSGYYILNISDYSLNTTGIIVNSSNVILNGNEAILNFTTTNCCGVNITNRTNITIENLTIEGFSNAIYLKNSSNICLQNINALYGDTGIYEMDSKTNILSNISTYHTNWAITSQYTSNDIISNVNINYSGGGLVLLNCTNDNISDINIKYCKLSMVANSTNYCIFKNINISKSEFGMGMTFSHYDTLYNITSQNCLSVGVALYISSDNNLTKIDASNNALVGSEYPFGIALYNSNNNSMSYITACNESYGNGTGILFYSSNNNSLYYVNASNNDIGLELNYSLLNTLSYMNVFNNSNRGIYLFSSNNITISDSNVSYSWDGIYIEESQYCNVLNTNSSNNGASGIFIYSSSHYTKIINTTTSGNGHDGIYIKGSNNNLLENINNTNNMHYGFHLYSSMYNIIKYCNILNNNWSGIIFENSLSSNNTVYLNSINNSLNIYSASGAVNRFNSPIKLNYTYNGKSFTNYLGNYYSDYNGTDSNNDGIGDTPYIIDSNNNDTYPLIKEYYIYVDTTAPTVDINTPENTSYLVYHTPEINATVKDNYKVDSVIAEIHYANGTISNITLTNVNGTNDYTNTTTLNFSTLGSYLIKIYANDTSGNLNNTENVSFKVIDNESPTVSINTPENTSYLVYHTPEINATVKDNYKVDRVIAEIHYANGTVENITLTNVNGTNDYVNTTTLNFSTLGSYLIKIYANDTSGNLNNTENVSFTVIDNITPTVEINSPINTSYLLGNVSKINATVIDNYKVDSVIAEIPYANGTMENITLSKVNGTNDYINTTTLNYPIGTNTIVIFANDTSGNLNNTENISFKVVPIPTHKIYYNEHRHSYPGVSNTIKYNSMKERVFVSKVLVGSSVDDNYAKELKDSVEYANSSENITQDVILIGGSVANPLTNKYMNKFPVNITNKYPGKNIGVIQKTTMMVKKENNIYANISVILLAGSDRYGTKAAVEYFKTLNDIPDEPVYVQWKDGKVVKIDKINH